MTAIFRINQPGISGGKPPVGDWDTARADLDLFAVGGSVGLEAQDTMTSYLWQIISEPEGSAIVLGSATSQTATMNITVTGGYLVRLTVDEGLPTKGIKERYVGVPLAASGLPIPALNETIQDNRDTDAPGYERKMVAWMKVIDATIGGGTGVFEEPVGPTLSTRRYGSGAIIGGNYSFSAGAINNIDVTSHYAFVYGGSTSAGSANVLVNSPNAVVFGLNNDLTNATHSFIQGVNNTVYGALNFVSGGSNLLGSGSQDRSRNTVFGDSNDLTDADGVFAVGDDHSCSVNSRRSTVLGSQGYPTWPGTLQHSMNPYLSYGAGQYTLAVHMSAEETGNSWTKLQLTAGGPIYDLELQNQTIYLCELRLIGRTVDSTGNPSKLKTWSVRFTVHNDFDNNVVLYPIDKTVLAMTSVIDEASWDVDVAVTMATSPPRIEILVKGAVGVYVRWYGVLSVVSYEDVDLSPEV